MKREDSPLVEVRDVTRRCCVTRSTAAGTEAAKSGNARRLRDEPRRRPLRQRRAAERHFLASRKDCCGRSGLRQDAAALLNKLCEATGPARHVRMAFVIR